MLISILGTSIVVEIVGPDLHEKNYIGLQKPPLISLLDGGFELMMYHHAGSFFM
jgi:hypothetical protein